MGVRHRIDSQAHEVEAWLKLHGTNDGHGHSAFAASAMRASNSEASEKSRLCTGDVQRELGRLICRPEEPKPYPSEPHLN